MRGEERGNILLCRFWSIIFGAHAMFDYRFNSISLMATCCYPCFKYRSNESAPLLARLEYDPRFATYAPSWSKFWIKMEYIGPIFEIKVAQFQIKTRAYERMTRMKYHRQLVKTFLQLFRIESDVMLPKLIFGLPVQTFQPAWKASNFHWEYLKGNSYCSRWEIKLPVTAAVKWRNTLLS